MLLRVEQLVLGDQAVAARVVRGVPLQVGQLLDHLPLARFSGAEGRREAVDLGVVPAEWSKQA